MKIIPAIDLRNGQVVRLEQGRPDVQTTYSGNPVAFALSWQQQGAMELHVVDLDGAFIGKPHNLPVVAKIVEALAIPIELGGGMRDEKTIAKALAAGVKRVVVGTKACQSLDFVRTIVDRFGGSQIAVGVDARDGVVATKGWTEASAWKAVDFASAVKACGVGTIVYTDIATDGMFTGPNLEALREILQAVDGEVKVIASGGIATVEHVRSLRALPGLYGAIVGKALYDKRLTLKEIL
jgi:phosphoribosylformimino-5-aminoimidazole carboxamide ribotide isomerase